MKMDAFAFGTTDWAQVERTEHKGETGKFDKYFSAEPGAGD